MSWQIRRLSSSGGEPGRPHLSRTATFDHAEAFAVQTQNAFGLQSQTHPSRATSHRYTNLDSDAPFPMNRGSLHTSRATSQNQRRTGRYREKRTSKGQGGCAGFLARRKAALRNANPRYRGKDIRGHFVAISGEFIGTVLFLWFSLAGTSFVLNEPPGSVSAVLQTYYAAVLFGISLLANVWVFYRISGGLFNPAVTLALIISGQLPTVRGLLLIPTQFLAGMVAAALVQCMFPGPLSATTRLQGETSVVQGLFIEMFLTALLVITVLMLAAEKSKDTFLAPVGIGLAFFTAELVGIPFTGGSLNPARSFGPDVVIGVFDDYHWIYWLGPLLGALLAAGYYQMAKSLNYREANPGQDASDPED